MRSLFINRARTAILFAILGSERALFDRHIAEVDFNVDDFEVTLERDTPGSKEKSSMAHVGTGKVTVTYKPTEIARHYRYNVVLPPHDQFDRELKMNLFKTR